MCGMRNRKLPKVVILDGCALLWTVPWPASPTKVSAFINAAVTISWKEYKPQQFYMWFLTDTIT